MAPSSKSASKCSLCYVVEHNHVSDADCLYPIKYACLNLRDTWRKQGWGEGSKSDELYSA